MLVHSCLFIWFPVAFSVRRSTNNTMLDALELDLQGHAAWNELNSSVDRPMKEKKKSESVAEWFQGVKNNFAQLGKEKTKEKSKNGPSAKDGKSQTNSAPHLKGGQVYVNELKQTLKARNEAKATTKKTKATTSKAPPLLAVYLKKSWCSEEALTEEYYDTKEGRAKCQKACLDDKAKCKYFAFGYDIDKSQNHCATFESCSYTQEKRYKRVKGSKTVDGSMNVYKNLASRKTMPFAAKWNSSLSHVEYSKEFKPEELSKCTSRDADPHCQVIATVSSIGGGKILSFRSNSEELQSDTRDVGMRTQGNFLSEKNADAIDPDLPMPPMNEKGLAVAHNIVFRTAGRYFDLGTAYVTDDNTLLMAISEKFDPGKYTIVDPQPQKSIFKRKKKRYLKEDDEMYENIKLYHTLRLEMLAYTKETLKAGGRLYYEFPLKLEEVISEKK